MSDGVVNLRHFPGTGFKRELPPDVVRVDRWSKWGNPYKVGALGPDGIPMGRSEAIAAYTEYMEACLTKDPTWLEPLRGKRLACWCVPLDCHATVIHQWLQRHPPLSPPAPELVS